MPFPVDECFIWAVEEKLAAKLPAAYVEAMKTENGGRVRNASGEWDLYPILDMSDKARLKRTCDDIVRETKRARDWPQFPGHAVAIAGNGSGDQLVFIRENAAQATFGDDVYWWYHETGKLNFTALGFSDFERV